MNPAPGDLCVRKGENDMIKFNDSLRGYGFPIHKRDNFKCKYCGFDGLKSFDNWLNLSIDHLLPKEHPSRKSPDYIVTACKFCNGSDNQYFKKCEKQNFKFNGKSPEQLIHHRKKSVNKTRDDYKIFWENNVERLKK